MSSEREIIIRTLHQTLASCSSLIEAGELNNSEQSISDLADFLDSISNSAVAELKNDDSKETAIEILEQISQYVCSPSLKQEVIDGLAFELPKAAAKFACISKRCLEVAEKVIDQFVERCNPRDMLSILCEALGSSSELYMVPGFAIPILSGLSKVIGLIQRRHYEQINVVVPVILNVLQTMSSKSDDEDADYEELFHKATDIATSIQTVSERLEGKDKHKVNSILGLYVLQIMALVSIGMRSEISRFTPVVVRLSILLRHCEFSSIGLITGCEVDVFSKVVLGDDGDDNMKCFSHVKLGASLGVIWCYKNSEVAIAAKADLTAIQLELQSNMTRRWEALGMLKYIYLCANLSWELKMHAIKFLLCVMDDIVPHSYDDHVDYSTYMLTLYTGLQAIEMVIIYAADAELRRDAFSTLKKVLADIPTSLRFDVLRALIKNSDSSSMIAILLGFVKEEMRHGKNEINSHISSFWSPSVLDLVEAVLKPPKGGPPVLPEYSDAVLSALNFYRFILIAESAGKSNYTGILSKDKLLEVYNEWLLPLRTLVARTVAENKENFDQLAFDATCALNPVEVVLYRCIELVEEEMKRSNMTKEYKLKCC